MSNTSRLLVLVALIAAGPLFAAEGRIPIYESIALDGALGDISGKYVVTRNITAGQVIFISGTGTEEIEIDLNGFTVEGTLTGAIVVNNVSKLRLENGTVRSGSTNAFTVQVDTGGESVILEDLTIQGGGSCIYVNNVTDATIRRVDCRDAAGASQAGISVGSPAVADSRVVIEDCLVRNAAGTGLLVNPVSNVTVKNNRVESSNRGIVAEGNGVVIVGNNVENSTSGGISATAFQACRISDNVINGSGGDGLLVGNSLNCSVIGNVASANDGNGIHLASSRYSLVLNNVCGSNGANGLLLTAGSWNHLDRNTLNANQNAGLIFNGDNNTFGRTTARGNAGAPACSTPPPGVGCATPDFCDNGNGNTSFGDNLAPGPPPC